MDHTSDDLFQGYGKRVLANHESKLHEQSMEDDRSVSIEPILPVTTRFPLQFPILFENARSHLPKWHSYEHSQYSPEDPLTAGILTRSQTLPASQILPSTISSRRGINLNLPPFDGLPRSPVDEMSEAADLNLDTSKSNESTSSEALTRVSSFPITIRSSSVGPPTPPIDADLSLWLFDASTSAPTSRSVDRNVTAVPAQQSAIVEVNNTSHQLRTTPSGHEVSNLNFAGTPWFQRVLGSICKLLNPRQSLESNNQVGTTIDTDTSSHSVKVISQILPMNASDQRPVKTYEMICDRIQQISLEPRTITITHTRRISPGQVVEDFPKSPPATPFRTGGDSYFGDQTIFTHVAEVPVHHDLRYSSQNYESLAQRHIMTAEASNIILERYIPPTTANETVDLFDANSCRSYLADRLPELAPGVGSLVFIYPTKTGAQIFTRRYIGPILDPLLREMSILKGLNTNAAEKLGRMKSVETMFEFGEMQEKLKALCDSMNSRITFQRTKTEFTIEHSERAHVVLDRDTWMTWFIEQEQQRLKQDLVDYHREGGRLPDTENVNTEVTAGMLSRDITDGLRKSTKIAGEVGVEIGVFVIRRCRKNVVS